jgi:flagellar motor switch protein FliN/FliY
MNDLSNLDIRTAIIESILKTFDAMMSLDVEYSEVESPPSPADDVIQSAAQLSGDTNGILKLQVPGDLARIMLANKGGVNVEDLEGDEGISELLSDILNSIGNDLKALLSEAGFACNISTPDAADEPDKQLDSEHLEEFEQLIFRHQEHNFQIDVGISASEHPSKDASRDDDQKEAPGEDPADAQQEVTSADDLDLEVILDIPIELTVELGRARIPINELLQLGLGSAISLSKLEGDPVDILANDTLIAKGQVVVQDEKYGIRVTEITSRMERIKSLS